MKQHNPHTLTVRAEDSAGNRSDDVTFTINVSDLNDNDPVVDDIPMLYIDENISDSTVIHTVSFSDVDTVNGTTEYFLNGLGNTSTGKFEINGSGEISLMPGVVLDYNTLFLFKNTYGMTVYVYDGNKLGAESVQIQINEPIPNDHAPVVDAASATVVEGINEHSVMHRVTFSDADDQPLARDYTFSLTQNPSDLFEIDGSGNITLAAGKDIDFATATNPYTVTVQVSDGELTGTADINLTFTDALSSQAIDLSNNEATFKIIGDGDSDNMGASVSFAGDVNGDGFDDLIVGASIGDTNGTNRGSAYVVFGMADGFANITENELATGNGGFQIVGDDNNDQAGNIVSSVREISTTTVTMYLIVTARAAEPGGGDLNGEAYVVYGQA